MNNIYLISQLLPDHQAREEQRRITRDWSERDRTQIRCYEDARIARSLMQAKLGVCYILSYLLSVHIAACSRAIAGRRSAFTRGVYEEWLRRQRPVGLGTWGLGGHANAAGWGSGTGWGSVPASHDPLWDGVTRVPKTPGKNRRRRQRARERQERAAAYAEETRQAGEEWAVCNPESWGMSCS